MHGHEKDYDPNCEGCVPALIDLKTGRPLPKDHPAMVRVLCIWHETDDAVKAAFIRATSTTRPTPADVEAIRGLVHRISSVQGGEAFN